MRNICAALFIFSVIAINGCKGNKDLPCDPVTTAAPASEVATLKAYIQNNNIDAVADSRGFYYHISNPGSGDKPSSCASVKINYTGKLTDGKVFDQASGVTFTLSGLITGWQEGVPLIAKGGSIILYLPPSLAYGQTAQNGIPANSILVFNIDLISF